MNQQPRQPTDSARRRSALNRRLRIAFIAGAEEELRRVLRRYPGDLPERYRAGFRPARIHLDGEG
jgi:hypothetical protein